MRARPIATAMNTASRVVAGVVQRGHGAAPGTGHVGLEHRHSGAQGVEVGLAVVMSGLITGFPVRPTCAMVGSA